MDKTYEFLRRGYFPVQLPPGFTTESFAANYKKATIRWRNKKPPRCRVERFSVARSSYNRRITAVLNPVPFFLMVADIAKFWGRIQNHYSQTQFSLSRPSLKPSIRAIEISRFSELYEKRLTMSAGYKYALITDISRFFPTIYTHTIPWALHGREVAKNNRKETDDFFGNILDKRSMGIQDWQTVGLPIGPDTSHVIAEIVATAIDKRVRESANTPLHGFRYVDDYCFFFNDRTDADRVLSIISKAVTAFELQINPDKTRIIEVKDLVEESWKYTVRTLDMADHVTKQCDDIHRCFETLFALEKRYKDESLVKYGLRKLSTRIIKKSNWPVFEAYLLKCGYAFPNTLQVITMILSTYHRYDYPIDRKAIGRFCNNLILTHAVSDGHSEIAWALWLAKELNIKIDKPSVRAVEGSSSSVCKIILLDLAFSHGNSAKPLQENIRPYSTKAELFGESWLLAYEGGQRRWLFNSDSSYIENDDFFGELIKHNVSFYDGTVRCPPIFTLKDDVDIDWDEIFDSDSDVEHLFDFEDVSEEYMDSTNEADLSVDEPGPIDIEDGEFEF